MTSGSYSEGPGSNQPRRQDIQMIFIVFLSPSMVASFHVRCNSAFTITYEYKPSNGWKALKNCKHHDRRQRHLASEIGEQIALQFKAEVTVHLEKNAEG